MTDQKAKSETASQTKRRACNDVLGVTVRSPLFCHCEELFLYRCEELFLCHCEERSDEAVSHFHEVGGGETALQAK